MLVELVSKMSEMCMDKTELGCLRAIVLFNPDVKGLKDIARVEQLRERVYASLEEYTRYYLLTFCVKTNNISFSRSTHENETGRFAKLLLRLPGTKINIIIYALTHKIHSQLCDQSALNVWNICSL